MKEGAKLTLLLLAPFVVAEVWRAFRPDDLESEIRDWFDTGRGRFEVWLAERERE